MNYCLKNMSFRVDLRRDKDWVSLGVGGCGGGGGGRVPQEGMCGSEGGV